MERQWSEEAERLIADIAGRHGFGAEAGRAMASALAAGGGAMAQFGHPDLGGMGQWSQGGMLMIGDMFNDGLKARVRGLADDLAEATRRGAIASRPQAGGGGWGGAWWPGDLGTPSSSGSQNGRRYAVFPDARRLALERDGRVTIHDTGEHRIGGVSQRQGGGYDLTFSSDRGQIRSDDLPEVRTAEAADAPAASSRAPDPTPSRNDGVARHAPEQPSPQQGPPLSSASGRAAGDGGAHDLVDLIRRLAELRDAGALTDAEFAAKKSEILGRL